MSGERTYTLVYPVTVHVGDREEKISEVTLRRPNAGDLLACEAAGTGGTARTVAMVERLSGLTGIAVKKLDALDFMAIDEIVESFMTPGQSTGGKSSGT
jgi:hypothetical protein